MSNGDTATPYSEHELIAVRMKALGCCPTRIPQLVEPSIPASAIGFRFEGEIPQTGLVWNGSSIPGAVFITVNIVSVPKSMSGVINKFSVMEHYPGAFQGAFASLTINGGVSPFFPRVGVNVQNLACPLDVWIPINENDVLGIEIECHWNTRMFIGQNANTHMLTWTFVLMGYWLEQNWWSDTKANEEAY